MTKQFLVALWAIFIVATVELHAETTTLQNLVGQNWYCTDSYQGIHKYIFSSSGNFTEAFFTPTPKGPKYWNPEATGIGYVVVSPSEIKILDSSFNPPVFAIQALSSQVLNFSQGSSSYTCSHVPPPGDTPANAAAVASERAAEMKFFYGKWVTRDGLQSVEFLPDGNCVITSQVKGNKVIDISMYKGTVHAKFSLYSGGNDIQCDGEGAFSRVTPNRIDFAVQSATISLYRALGTKTPR